VLQGGDRLKGRRTAEDSPRMQQESHKCWGDCSASVQDSAAMTGDPDTAAILTGLFGLGRAVDMQQVARGAMGAVWKLSVEGASYALKEPYWQEPCEQDVLREVGFRASCARRGVPSPEPIASTTGKYLVSDGTRSWRVYDWIDGLVPDRKDVAVTTWLAAQMGAIHSLGWAPGDGNSGSSGPEAFYHRVDVDWVELAATAEKAGVDWAPALGALVPQLEELSELVNGAPVGAMVWCHRDLKNTNVLVGLEANWLVDWDNVGPMTPWRELGHLLMHHLDSETNLRQITSAYRGAGGTASIEGPEGFATGLAVWLNFLHGQATSVLDSELEDEHRAYALEKVVPLLRSMPDLRALEQASLQCR
jgi:Ser/Thr protein kinase RdoA (MazF antagonist)